MEQNYRLTIAYDGSRFFGWERQPGKDTIQGKLEAVLGQLQGRPVNVIGDGELVVLFQKITPFPPYHSRKSVICEVFYNQFIILIKL